MQPKRANLDDIADCQAIYAQHVLGGTGSFEEIPPSVEEMEARFKAVDEQGWAWLVLRDSSGILGFGYYAQFRPRSAYRFTAEDSIYVRDNVRGRGIGKILLAALLQHAIEGGFKEMLALIGDSQNAASRGIHASLGFLPAGTMHKVGYKFGHWLDVVIMQKSLTHHHPLVT